MLLTNSLNFKKITVANFFIDNIERYRCLWIFNWNIWEKFLISLRYRRKDAAAYVGMIKWIESIARESYEYSIEDVLHYDSCHIAVFVLLC